MMMSTSKSVSLKKIMAGESSREKAAKVRADLLLELGELDTLDIDFEGANFTPSVADELIGSIAIELGPKRFKDKIKIINASGSQMALMKHVVARRAANASRRK